MERVKPPTKLPTVEKHTESGYNLMVAVRIRPLSPSEKEKNEVAVAYRLDDRVCVLRDSTEIDKNFKKVPEKRYAFDRTLGPDATQKEVYEKTTRHLIDGVVDGYNATVFAYGATGAGKTYTMVGTSERPGVMARALDDLFKSVNRTGSGNEYHVKMSYLEIYNEQIKDLLQSTSSTLELQEDGKGIVQVRGLSEIKATSSRDMLEQLVQGNRRRTCEPTARNKTSSRSHALLLISVTLKEEFADKPTAKPRKDMGRLILIDLAGSEKAATEGPNSEQRQKEGSHINKSLLALGNVITTLTEKGSKYVNYRDSKLTRLLKDSLGGNSITVMIANVSPAKHHYEESRNTLIYADRAKNITNKVSDYLI